MYKILSEKTKANIALLISGILFGVSSPLARLMGIWLNPFSVVFLRFLCALPFSFIYLKNVNLKNIEFKKLTYFGLLFPVSVCLYTFSLFNTKISLSIFSFYISNLISSILVGYFFNKETFSINKSIGFSLALIALILFTNPLENFSINTGMIFGYLSGLTATFASFYQKKLSKTIDEKILTFTQITSGIIISLIAIIFANDLSIFTISLYGMFLSIIFGFIFFLINLLMIYGFKHAEIGTGTILLSSELLFGPIAAYFVFKETLSFIEILGGILITLAASFASKHKE